MARLKPQVRILWGPFQGQLELYAGMARMNTLQLLGH
jgi:hypothetical protein